MREGGNMIGALVAKRIIRDGFNQLNKGDATALLSRWSEDATLNYPGNMPVVSGVFTGKKTIEEWFTRFFEVFPKRTFTVKSVSVENIFDFIGTNTITVEWDVIVTNRQGKDFKNRGVTVLKSVNGSATSVSDYYFDIDALREAWGEEKGLEAA